MTLILVSLTVLLLSHVAHCLWFDRKQLSLKEEVKELKEVILTLESMESKAIKEIAALQGERDRLSTAMVLACERYELHAESHDCVPVDEDVLSAEFIGDT